MSLRLLAACCCSVAFAQSAAPSPKFEAADIQPVTGRTMRGPFAGGGRWEVRSITMLDLIRTAYGIDSDKIYGGPSWLEFDRFDVVAKLPAESTAESRPLMLRQLLADRFHLVVHNEERPMPAYALTAGKHAGLKAADPAGEPGCKSENQRFPRPAPSAADGAPPAPPPPPAPSILFTCHRLTMAALADEFSKMPGAPQYLARRPVLDKTGLTGAWDFSFHYSVPIGLPLPDTTTLFEAMDKQLGLTLEPATAPQTVLVVDKVDRAPTAISPELLKTLPAAPNEFEVSEIKPAEASANARPGTDGMVLLNGQPAIFSGGRLVQPLQNGRVSLPYLTLKQLILMAWDLPEDRVAGLPKFAQTNRFDVIAKLPTVAGAYEGISDMDMVRPLLRVLLVEKFKIASHQEDRPADAFVLTANKPKLKAADPAARTRCHTAGAAAAATQTVTCQNVTMAQFAALIPTIAGGYPDKPALDETGLDGAWDFTVSFANGRGLQLMQALAGPGSGTAADPVGGPSLMDALNKQLGLKLEQQKRPVPVLVIDHIDPRPVEN